MPKSRKPVEAATDASEGAAVSAPQAPTRAPAATTAPKRRGRKKGVPNKITKDVKATIMRRGKPLELLCDVARGVKIRIGPQAGPDREYVYPDLSMRVSAARVLLAKVAPDMKAVELAGKDGEPLVPNLAMPDRELARRVALILKMADMVKGGSGGDGRPPHPPAQAGAQAHPNAEDGAAPSPAAPKDTKLAEARPRARTIDAPPAAPASALSADGGAPAEPPRPKPGEEVVIGPQYIDEATGTWHAVKVRNIGPVRDGPDRFVVLDGGLIVNNAGGDYDKALAWARERFNYQCARAH